MPAGSRMHGWQVLRAGDQLVAGSIPSTWALSVMVMQVAVVQEASTPTCKGAQPLPLVLKVICEGQVTVGALESWSQESPVHPSVAEQLQLLWYLPSVHTPPCLQGLGSQSFV
eukprot:343067_1